jgi:UDP-N-acetylglucosamine:LPS N-acetylglucosamine transferase
VRVVFLLSDTGGGHRAVAEAIAADLLAAAPGRLSCDVVDLFVEADLPVLRRAGAIYRYFAARRQRLYNLGFRMSDRPGFMRLSSALAFRLRRRRIQGFFTALTADVVVVTHPLFVPSLTGLARRRLGLPFALVTVVTDIVTPHASWAWPGVDLCLVPSAEAFERLTGFGLAPPVLRRTEFPVGPRFRAAGRSRSEARRELGLDEDRCTVLVTGGGEGLGPVAAVVQAVESTVPDVQILALVGHNDQLYEALRRSCSPSTRVLRHARDVSGMLAAADLVIGKAGPSTMMEARAAGVPIIVIDEVGRQEEGNAAYAERNGIGWACRDISQLPALVEKAVAGTLPGPVLAETEVGDGASVADTILALTGGCGPRSKPAG